MKAAMTLSTCALTLLAARSSTPYVMSTMQGTLFTVSGKPLVDEKTGAYGYTDTEGRRGAIRKDEVVQVIEG